MGQSGQKGFDQTERWNKTDFNIEDWEDNDCEILLPNPAIMLTLN